MKSVFALITFVISLTSFNNAFAGSLEQQMIKELEEIGAVRTLQTSFTGFHYAGMEGFGLPKGEKVNTEDSKLISHVTGRIDHFWDPNQAYDPENTYSGGFYLAIDPFTSRPWGGDNFMLYLIKLEKGIRYVVLDEIEWSSKTTKALKSRGCTQNGSMKDTLLTTVSKACRDIALPVLKTIGAQAIFYTWRDSTIENCVQLPAPFAIVVTDKKVVKLSEVKILAASGTIADQFRDDQVAIESLFRHDKYNKTIGEKMPMWPSMNLPGNIDLEGWKKANLVQCMPNEF